jgi:hypothetical protein
MALISLDLDAVEAIAALTDLLGRENPAAGMFPVGLFPQFRDSQVAELFAAREEHGGIRFTVSGSVIRIEIPYGNWRCAVEWVARACRGVGEGFHRVRIVIQCDDPKAEARVLLARDRALKLWGRQG